MRKWLRYHGLSVTMLAFFAIFLAGQFLSGFHTHNDERESHGEPRLTAGQYARSAHFLEATSENWESEFFQMFVYVLGTAYLYQIGSAESKDPRKKHSHHDSGRGKHAANCPGPVKRGGIALRLYEFSLTIALFILFAVSFAIHAGSGLRLHNEELAAHGEPAATLGEFMTSSRFWFESFQNWQSEFLSIAAMVLLSIFLRQKNSPESKDVETPHWENEE